MTERLRPCLVLTLPSSRALAIALVRSGKQVKQTAYELGISAGCLHEWLKPDCIDRGEIPGETPTESAELRAARKRIRELETELAIFRQAAKFLDQDKPHPGGFTHLLIDRLADAGFQSTSAARSSGCSGRATIATNADQPRRRNCAASC